VYQDEQSEAIILHVKRTPSYVTKRSVPKLFTFQFI